MTIRGANSTAVMSMLLLVTWVVVTFSSTTTRSVDASATSAVSPRTLFSIKRRRSLSRKQPRRKRPLSSKHNEEEEERFLQSSSSSSSSSSTSIVDAESACKASLPTEQAAGADFGAVCECRPHQGNKAMLSCVDTACWYCNLNATLCDEFSYGVIFDAHGNEEAYWEQDQYKVGRNERLRFIEYYMDSSTAANDDDDAAAATLGECSLEINGQACRTCRFVECDDGEYYGMDFDCSNLLVGDGVVSTFNACTKDDENENQQENEETKLHFTLGIFQLYHDDYGYCYGAYDGCEWEMEELVSNGQYNCECVESEEEEVLLLTCQHSCNNPICNLGTSSMDSCIQTERIVQSYPNLLKRNQTRTVTTKNDGTIITMEEWSCDDTRCRDCRATIGDKECNSCIMQSCRDGGGDDTIHNRAVFKPKIDCSNIQSKWNGIDLCSTDTDATETSIPFEYFTTLQNDSNSNFQCMTSAGLACLASKDERQSIDPHLDCTCEQQQQHQNQQQQTDSTAHLTCVTNCGDVCSDNICFRETLMQTFDGTSNSQQQSALSRTIQYTFGLQNTVTYEETDGGDDNNNDVSCRVTVDGIKCNSCRKDICNDESAILVDCSNVDEKAVAESCDESSTNYKDGFLRRFAQNEWESCQIKSIENTLCSTAERVNLSPGRADLFGSTMSVPVEDSDPLISCNGDSASPGVWYTIQGRGTGLEASVCDDKTDFNAQISVFAGSVCDNDDSNNKPECIGSTAHGDDCNVKWYASEESTYFLRIYGKDETSTGNFVLTVQEFDYIAELCSQHKELLEALEHKEFVCECSNESLQCTNKCVMCNEDITICGQEQVSIQFDSATASAIRQTGSLQYLFGKNNNSSIVVEEILCTSSVDSGTCESSCRVAIDGVLCDKCQVVDCKDGNDYGVVTASKMGLEITCDNVDADFSMNTCHTDEVDMVTSTNIATSLPTSLGTVPLMFYQDDLSYCLEMNGHLACMKELSTLSLAMDTIQCQCEERNGTIGEFELTCIDTSCLKCNPERRFCGFDTIQSDFLISGEPREFYNGFMVLDGRPGANSTSKELGYAMASSGCSTTQDPKETCLQELERITSEDPSSNCDCEESEHSDGAYDLLCTVPPSCEYCNEDKSMCAQPLQFGQRINQYGHLTDELFNSFLYTKGREELITVGKDGVDCTVSIDGQECSRCEQIRCNEASFLPQQVEIATSLTRSAGFHSGSFLELHIDCSNVFEGLYQNVVYSCGVTMLTELDGNATVLTGSGMGSGDDQNSVFAIFEGSMEKRDCGDDEATSEDDEATPEPIEPSTIHPTNDKNEINNLFGSAGTRTVTATWIAGIFLILFLDVWCCR